MTVVVRNRDEIVPEKLKNVEKISRKELPKDEEIIVPIVAESHVSRESRLKFCV